MSSLLHPIRSHYPIKSIIIIIIIIIIVVVIIIIIIIIGISKKW